MPKDFFVLKVHEYQDESQIEFLNPSLHGGHCGPPINFEASQLQQEGFTRSNLHMNLVIWKPTMTKTQKMFQNVHSV